MALPCKARRTTPRGWGEWVDGTLELPPVGGPGEARFVPDDPTSVALVTRQGAAPVVMAPPLDVSVRPVRYRAEAFHGQDAEVVVVSTERRVVELALPPEELESAARRLSELA